MTDKNPSGGVVCHYCHNPGHVFLDCRKLQNKYRRFQYARESFKSAYTPSTMPVKSGNLTHVLFPLHPNGSLTLES